MKHLISRVLALFFVLMCCVSPAQSQIESFSSEVLEKAFESGRSLLIIKILATRQREPRRNHNYAYISQAQVVRAIVPGDLVRNDLNQPINLFAGGDKIKVGALYAMFVMKESPHIYSWVNRNSLISLDPNDDTTWRALATKAQQVYQTTAIRQFRATKFTGKPKLPPLPAELINASKQFKKHPKDRLESARLIGASVLANTFPSSFTISSMMSSQLEIEFLPPKVVLNRRQILFLLGEPTFKVGRTYTWFCGEEQRKTRNDEPASAFMRIINVLFDEKEQANVLVYSSQYSSQTKEDWFGR